MPSFSYGPDRFGPEMSLSCVHGLPFKNSEKAEWVRVIRLFSMIYAVGVLGFSIMDNHFHLLIEME